MWKRRVCLFEGWKIDRGVKGSPVVAEYPPSKGQSWLAGGVLAIGRKTEMRPLDQLFHHIDLVTLIVYRKNFIYV